MAAHFETEAVETHVMLPRGDDPNGFSRALEAAYEAATIEVTKSQREELKAAKDLIAKDKDKIPTDLAVRSFNRAADAIKNGIRVFISYKFIQRPLAEKFRALIIAYGQSRLARDPDGKPHVFLAQRDVTAGAEYRKQIREEIENAHWFFLLLPDMQFDREWPIWEAGYFRRGMAASERLICVHDKSIDTAAQLEDLQAYESSAERLKELFTQLFFKSQAIPGMNQICFDDISEKLPQDVKILSDLFMGPQPVPVPKIYSSFVNIKHKEGSTYDKIDDLLSSQIINMENLEDVFGHDDNFRKTFGDLIASVNDEEHGQQWIEGLRAALSDVVSTRPPQPIRVPFLGAQRGGVFWSHLHSVWSYDGGRIDYFQVIFLKGPPRVSNVPVELDALETAVRWAYRSWWEIYGAFCGFLQAADVDEIYRYTQIAEQESHAHGVTDPKILLKAFKDPDIKRKLECNLEKYYNKYRNPKTKDGKIDVAFRDRNPTLMRECLEELRPMSLWFLKVASARFAELIAEIVPEK
jgi:hypothetical protein